MANKIDISPEVQAANRILYHDYAKSVADEADWHAQMTTAQELGHPFAAPAPSDAEGVDQGALEAGHMNDVGEDVLYVDRKRRAECLEIAGHMIGGMLTTYDNEIISEAYLSGQPIPRLY
ncbi:MAG TPA: hypothetical protein VLF40_05295 [Candidatus Saccharimonadales bacterium]|nr:hypothetical protein [Candidatus Saccharimonadales bacterium]